MTGYIRLCLAKYVGGVEAKEINIVQQNVCNDYEKWTVNCKGIKLMNRLWVLFFCISINFRIDTISKCHFEFIMIFHNFDRLWGLVVRVPGCESRGPGFDSLRYQIFRVAAGLERGPLGLMRINEELLEIKVAAPV
jgi:hypothetical protein